jgi:flavin-dependent dehydrogenase
MVLFLVGNAVGLVKPVTGEGIGTGVKGGFMGVESVIQAIKRTEEADKFYLPIAQDLVSRLNSTYPSLRKNTRNRSKRDGLFSGSN